MKNNKLLFILTATCIISAKAQITINKNHFTPTGRSFLYAYDNSLRALPSKGPNQVWDLRDLVNDDSDSFRIGKASNCPGHAHFPYANLGKVWYSEPNEIDFWGLTDTALISYGEYSFDSTDSEASHFGSPILTYPSTYMTAFSYSGTLRSYPRMVGYDPDTAGPWPFVDSIVITDKMEEKSEINGWGLIRTPLGDFPALRQDVLYRFIPTYKMFSNGVASDPPSGMLNRLNLSTWIDSSFHISFWTNDSAAGMPLVTFYHNAGDDSTEDVEWLASAPRAVGIKSTSFVRMQDFVYPNPADDNIYLHPSATKGTLSMYDMSGRRVMQQEIEGGIILPVSGYPQGAYTIQLVDSVSGKITLQKVLIAH